MRFKTWPVAALGFGSLLVLLVVSMLAASRRTAVIYTQLDALNTYHHEVDAKLRRLRSDVHLSGIFIRDSLLDLSSEHSAEYRKRLAEFRRTSKAAISELRFIAEGYDERIRRLEAQLDEYWRSQEPVFDWTPAQKASLSASFLRQEVVPRREKVMSIAYEIEALNEANLSAERNEVARQHAAFRAGLSQLLWQSIALSVAVALVSVLRLRSLERRSDEQRRLAQAAEGELRQLSQRLVATQEEERRNLSRELHDQLAQVLTALRMEVSRIDRARTPEDTRIAAAAAECRSLIDRMFRSVRDLALGLRPSMLDDFGLQPALEWLVRDCSTRYGIDAEFRMAGDFRALPDRYRTCVYRVVQEALTNCVRHAQAASIDVTVAAQSGQLQLTVTDNGVGLDPSRAREGLGLRGIEERVKELGGTMTIIGSPATGTTLNVRLPLSWPETEAALARAAG